MQVDSGPCAMYSRLGMAGKGSDTYLFWWYPKIDPKKNFFSDEKRENMDQAKMIDDVQVHKFMIQTGTVNDLKSGVVSDTEKSRRIGQQKLAA